jgi:hypothetical protein
MACLRGRMTTMLLLLQLVAVLHLISIAFAWSSECPGKINSCNKALSATASSKSKNSFDACLITCSNAYGDWMSPNNGDPWAAMDCVVAQSGLQCPFNPAERTTSDCSRVIGVCTGAPVDRSRLPGKQPNFQALQQPTTCPFLQTMCSTCLETQFGTPAVCGPVCSLRC